MASKWRFLSIAAVFIVPLVIAFSSGERADSSPQVLTLICRVDTITTALNSPNIVVPVNVTNLADSVAGFQLWINISEPSLVKFKADSVSGGIYYAKIDTIGTRIKGWEYLQARILDDTIGAVLRVAGTADAGGFPLKPPVPPGSGTFLRLHMETKGALGDSLCDSARVVLAINFAETRFSDPHGDLIAYACSATVDTVYQNCAVIVNDTCQEWFDTTIVPGQICWFDTLQGSFINGGIGFACCKCGDADGNNIFTISDAVFLITYIFGGGPAPNPSCLGDADGNGITTISDAVFLITFIFGGGPVPHC